MSIGLWRLAFTMAPGWVPLMKPVRMSRPLIVQQACGQGWALMIFALLRAFEFLRLCHMLVSCLLCIITTYQKTILELFCDLWSEEQPSQVPYAANRFGKIEICNLLLQKYPSFLTFTLWALQIWKFSLLNAAFWV